MGLKLPPIEATHVSSALVDLESTNPSHLSRMPGILCLAVTSLPSLVAVAATYPQNPKLSQVCWSASLEEQTHKVHIRS